MASILDYLDWRGDITFAERAFNEVDNLLLAELSYLDFGGIVPADFAAAAFRRGRGLYQTHAACGHGRTCAG